VASMAEFGSVRENLKKIEIAGTPAGWQYALRIVLGCTVAWYALHFLGIPNALWALISVIIVTEPQPSAAWLAFISRIVNTMIGAAIGLPLMYFLGPSFWSVLLGITISVVICMQLTSVPGSWRVAPITVAIVMTPSVLAASRSAGIRTAIDRTEEVLIGSAVALLITLCGSFVQARVRRWNELRGARGKAV
jgi:uncharacterized membrane protein YccC